MIQTHGPHLQVNLMESLGMPVTKGMHRNEPLQRAYVIKI
jgi:hypothetical protein